ncbi:MAG: DUF1194 domain-containing protein [Rhodovibrionaceae bacterium]|nr:DUF1194 domain-containing protein [Rhodovibrionaceae bacterium]
MSFAIAKTILGLAIAAVLSALLDDASAAQPRPVALELVLAIDTSSSIDGSEFELQRQGLARAFRNPDVGRAIMECGAEGVAIAVVQWSGNRMQLTSVDWTLIRDREDAVELAAAIESAPRLLTGFTGLGGAIRFSLRKIEENEYDGRRMVIDISGDGTSSGLKPYLERDRAVARGATINALAILNEEPDLASYYADYVIGGEGAFLMSAGDFEDFAEAIRHKLLREIDCPKVALDGSGAARAHF